MWPSLSSHTQLPAAAPDGPALQAPVHTLLLSPGHKDDLHASSRLSRWPLRMCVCSCLGLGGEPAAWAHRKVRSARSWLPGAQGPLFFSGRPALRPHHCLLPRPKQSRGSLSTLSCSVVVLTTLAMTCFLVGLFMSGFILVRCCVPGAWNRAQHLVSSQSHTFTPSCPGCGPPS